MLMSSGFTDDLFPADETIRFYNRTRTQYPDCAPGALLRRLRPPAGAEQGRRHRRARRGARTPGWTTTSRARARSRPRASPPTRRPAPSDAPSGGPYTAPNWAKAAPGEIRYDSEQSQTIDPGAGSEAIAATFNPVGGDGACATADGADQPGSATYRLDAAPAGGYTMLGSATVIADFTLPGDTSQVAARLLDVGPDGQRDARLARPLAPGDRRPDAAGVPAAPERLDVRRGPRAEARAAAEGHQPGAHRRLRARLRRPAAGHGLEPRAAAAGGRAAGQPRRARQGAGAERVLPEGYELAADFAALHDSAPEAREAEAEAPRAEAVREGHLPGPSSPPATTARSSVTTAKPKPAAEKKPKQGRQAHASSGSPAARRAKLGLKLTGKAKRYLAKQQAEAEGYVQIRSAELDRADGREGEGGREEQAVAGAAQPNSAPVAIARPSSATSARRRRSRGCGSSRARGSGSARSPLLRPAEAAGGRSPLSCSSGPQAHRPDRRRRSSPPARQEPIASANRPPAARSPRPSEWTPSISSAGSAAAAPCQSTSCDVRDRGRRTR